MEVLGICPKCDEHYWVRVPKRPHSPMLADQVRFDVTPGQPHWVEDFGFSDVFKAYNQGIDEIEAQVGDLDLAIDGADGQGDMGDVSHYLMHILACLNQIRDQVRALAKSKQ